MNKLKTLVVSAVVALGANQATAENAFVNHQTITPELADTMAYAAMKACRKMGAQVGVTVTDRFGLPQAFIRDRFAGPHVYETSRRKAWTSITFKGATTELHDMTTPDKSSYGIRFLSEALPLGGGLPVLNGEGSLVAAIGVSGAPSPEMDEECAQIGIDAIEEEIAF